MQPADTRESLNPEEANLNENLVEQCQSGQASKSEGALSFQDIRRSDFADPILDSEFALQMFEESLDPRKRTNDEAFSGDYDLFAPPEKRRCLEPPRAQGLSPPGEVPSLSSPGSSYRPDQVETVLNTPASVERLQTPDSLFDSLDHFEDPTFAVSSAETVPANGPNEVPLSNLEGIQQSTRPIREVASYKDDSPSIIDPAHPLADKAPSFSNITRRRFSLDDQDVIANATCEMLQRVDPQPEYISPYPLYGGPLGYLPSSPGIHVKSIQVAEDRVCERIGNLTRQVKRLVYERDKYKTAWSLYTTVDKATGKTKDKLLHEENGSLRRASSKYREQAEIYRREAEEWRNRFSDLAITYNNLLFEFQTQQRVTIAPPARHWGPPAPPAFSGNTAMQQAGQTPVPIYPTPNQQPVTIYPKPPRANQPAMASSIETCTAAPSADPITIDLTDDQPRSGQSRDGPQLLRSFRTKRYSWLENSSHNPVQGAERRPTCDDNISSGLGSKQPAASNADGPDLRDDDDDLVRDMEEELART